MYLMIWLNQTTIHPYTPLFEIIYGIELFCLFGCLALGPVMMYVSFRSQPLHRNLRINFTNGMLRVTIGSLARLILLYHQIFNSLDPYWLMIATCMREAFLNFFVGAMGAIAFDRFFATFYWKWYEKQSLSTLWVFVADDILLDGFSAIHTTCLVFEHITIYTNVTVFTILLLISAVSFIFIYRFNLKEIAHMKKGAQVDSYSIARSFQIRENIAVLQMLLRVAFPTVLFNGPAFFFFFVYMLVPSNCGYDFIKLLSIALFDLWIGIYALSLVSLMRLEPIFKKSFERLGIFSRKSRERPKISVRRPSQNDGDVYFKMFQLDIERRPN